MGDQMFNCRDVEERLAPFVDGSEAPDARRAIEAHLQRCPPCREHAEHERAAAELLHANRATLCEKAPGTLRARCACQSPGASRDQPAGQTQPDAGSWTLGAGSWKLAAGSWNLRRWVPLSLAASLLLAVAVVFVVSLNDRVEALATGLALDHAKCFRIGDSQHPADAAAVEQAWARDRGWPIRVAHSDTAEQLELVCVRRCISMDGLTAHVMYRWRGEPLSVYVLPHTVAESRLVDAIGHETAIWSDAGRTYAVMADGHPPDFDHIVSYVKDHTR